MIFSAPYHDSNHVMLDHVYCVLGRLEYIESGWMVGLNSDQEAPHVAVVPVRHRHPRYPITRG